MQYFVLHCIRYVKRTDSCTWEGDENVERKASPLGRWVLERNPSGHTSPVPPTGRSGSTATPWPLRRLRTSTLWIWRDLSVAFGCRARQGGQQAREHRFAANR